MPRVGFEPTISVGERPKTYALDRAATGTGQKRNWNKILAEGSEVMRSAGTPRSRWEGNNGIILKKGEWREMERSFLEQGQLMVACEPLGSKQFEEFLD